MVFLRWQFAIQISALVTARNFTLTNLTLYVPYIVTNYIHKPTRCTFCMYLFYNLCTTLHVSNDHFVHHQEFIIYCILQLCTNRANVRLYTAAEYSKSWTADDERNGLSKHVELYKDCRINTYRKCILLVCLYNNYYNSCVPYLIHHP